LLLVGTIVDEDTSSALDLPCPEIAFPSLHPDEAEVVQVDIAIVTLLDVPEQNYSQKPLSGAWAKVQGHATAQLQLSIQSPLMCQLATSAMRTSI
jgi:hypothetical protein